MALDFNIIRKLFRTQILGKTGVPANDKWAFEGEAFTPPAPAPAATWVRESMFVNEELPVIIGNLQQVTGIYMAVVHHPKGSGMEGMETAAKAIKESVGYSLSGGGVDVAIDKASRDGNMIEVEGAWKTRAVRFSFRAYSPA